jgi:YHS domain-containing protein
MHRIIVLLLFISTSVLAQSEHQNTKKNLAVSGYDLISYFDGKPQKGKESISKIINGIEYRFTSSKNAEKFAKDPKKYLPQYGGWCAYAMGINGEKVSINPKTYLITDGKLYLFYHTVLLNTKTKWEQENPKQLKENADKFWSEILKK